MQTFQELNLSNPILKAITDQGFVSPTGIQGKAIPLLLGLERDFVGQAQTGTGKTAAFLIPMLEKVDFSKRGMRVLVLTPTRELAGQVYQELEKLTKYLDIKATTVYGGVSYDKQIRALKKDKAQIVVGTPGRLLDLIRKGELDLSQCENLIIDEADEMLNMGFLEDVETILGELSENRKIWMFSATMPKQIKALVDKNFDSPEFVRSEDDGLTNTDIEQFYCPLDKRDFGKALRLILMAHPKENAIIFCETRMECKNFSEKLSDYGVSALALHGDLNQSQRDYAMAKFKAGKVQALVCTDIAARGIDVNNLSFVFNIGLPRQDESYVHRIGRTGRAGSQGTAITFLDPRDRFKLRFIERKIGKKIETYEMPTLDKIKEKVVVDELDKMLALRNALMERGEEFEVDPSFALFKEFFQGMTKEQIMSILFSFRFNQGFRHLKESLVNTKERAVSGGKREGRSGAARTGGRRSADGRGRRSQEGDARGGRGRRSQEGEARGGRGRRSQEGEARGGRGRRSEEGEARGGRSRRSQEGEARGGRRRRPQEGEGRGKREGAKKSSGRRTRQ